MKSVVLCPRFICRHQQKYIWTANLYDTTAVFAANNISILCRSLHLHSRNSVLGNNNSVRRFLCTLIDHPSGIYTTPAFGSYITNSFSLCEEHPPVRSLACSGVGGHPFELHVKNALVWLIWWSISCRGRTTAWSHQITDEGPTKSEKLKACGWVRNIAEEKGSELTIWSGQMNLRGSTRRRTKKHWILEVWFEK